MKKEKLKQEREKFIKRNTDYVVHCMEKEKCLDCLISRTCKCGHPSMFHLGISRGTKDTSCDVEGCDCLKKETRCKKHFNPPN